ncbi:MAG: DUF885 family protein [Bacteroidota bacterium]
MQIYLPQYHDDNLALFPINATLEGDNRYNDLLPVDFTDSYRDTTKKLYEAYLTKLSAFDSSKLNNQDKLSYSIFKYTLETNLRGLKFHDNYIPFNQMSALPLVMGQFASGAGAQPFKTVDDYDKWIKRTTAFSIWTDSAIIYFRKGIASGIVLPKSLVIKIIPQMKAMVTDTATFSKNLFYAPIVKMPASFSDADKKRLTDDYKKLINEKIVPTFSKLAAFFQDEYLPKARTTSGIGTIPGGKRII